MIGSVKVFLIITVYFATNPVDCGIIFRVETEILFLFIVFYLYGISILFTSPFVSLD